MSLPYLAQLDPARQTVFHNLGALGDRFILAGGTAIMLQIGHRASYDFDCFSLDPLPQSILVQLKRIFGPTLRPKLQSDDLIMVVTPEHIEIHLVFYPYPPLRPTIRTNTLPLFNLDDLASNKALTIGRRAAWRDYVDIFFLLKWNLYTLASIIQLATVRFGVEFNERLFIQQLTFFEDIEITDTIFLKESYTPKQITSYLEAQVRQYLKRHLP